MGQPTRVQKPGRLAAGPIRRWVAGKPRLVASGGEYARQEKENPQQLAWFHYLGVAARALVVLTVFAALVAVASWGILLSTVLATPTSNQTMYVVHRATWAEGKAPQGSVVYLTATDIDRSAIGRIKLHSGDQVDDAIVEVIAGPDQAVSVTENGYIAVNNIPTQYRATNPFAPHYLDRLYLVACIEGACGTPGTPLEVPVKRVLGKVMGTATFTGLTPVEPLNGRSGETSG
jgi:hypothetical protein